MSYDFCILSACRHKLRASVVLVDRRSKVVLETQDSKESAAWNHTLEGMLVWYISHVTFHLSDSHIRSSVCLQSMIEYMVYGTLSGVWAEMKDEGMPLFSAFKPCMVNKGLRKLLHDVGVQNPESYRSHDLRRGYVHYLF